VGLAQFPTVSPQYVRRPGALTYVAVIIDDKILVHNVYLQLWAETGIIGLVLFFVVSGVALAGGWRACVLFESERDAEMLALARAALLSLVAMLAASIFLSDDSNRQTWVLFALGPAMVGIALRRRQAATAELEAGWWRRRPTVSAQIHEPG
jgi:O-antigen ligase